MSHDCVVDASVAIKLFLREELSDRAAALFAQLTLSPPARFFVPDHFFIECFFGQHVDNDWKSAQPHIFVGHFSVGIF